MGKKYIMIGGQKVYLKDVADSEVKDEDEDEEKVEDDKVEDDKVEDDKVEDDKVEDEDEDIEDKVEKVAGNIVQSVENKLGLNDLKSKVDEVLSNQNKGNSKILEILKSKDLKRAKDKLTKEEKIVGFYHALVTGDTETVKALSEGTAADGGNLFPNEFRAELVRWLAEQNRMRSLVRVIPMRKDVLNAPSLVSSVLVYWTAENAAKTTTTAHFGQITLTARKVAAILYASDELIEDSTEIDVVQLVIQLFGEAIAEQEDRVIIAGNGTTEPTGILGNIGTVTTSGNLDFDDIIDLVYSLPQKYQSGSSFLIHRTNIKELRKLKDNDGRYIWGEPVANGSPATILGYPVYENNWVGEANILFGNWKLAYWLGDRKQMTVKISTDTTQAFTQDMTAIRVVARIGGNVVLAEAAKQLQTIP